MNQAELKRLRSLQQKKYREEHGRYLVQGRKVVEEVLASTQEVECVVATEEAAEVFSELGAQKGVAIHVLPQLELDRIGTFEKGNEIIAIVATPKTPPFAAPAPDEVVLALDGVRDPRNFGGLMRIADWYGIRRVICGNACMEPWNPKCVQSSMGSLFRVSVREVPDLRAELEAYAAKNAAIYIADMDGTPVYEAKLLRPSVLVLGSESHGHSESVEAMRADVLSIPRVGRMESLNVAMAASALLLEFTRQARR